eukprot:gnl/MRDRNA2_/MRDRNA2_239236_c0_seq1.p1 gnl/MRDRNA2_/MRDRNA2_239236_c0~~gnl/MRDRNA2_/MRDRNA2_239236_c0_seq1.p1  ORF type:complete len:347 (+),score=36.99 gnl/MRDRNA2_/MRDRNA2_239236_c0_seq1:81-1121(+)
MAHRLLTVLVGSWLNRSSSQYGVNLPSHGGIHLPGNESQSSPTLNSLGILQRTRKALKFPHPLWTIPSAATDVGRDEAKFSTRLLKIAVIGTYSIGIVSVLLGKWLGIPKLGFGKHAAVNGKAILLGLLSTIPLLLQSAVLESFREAIPGVKQCMKVTRAMSLQLFGAERRLSKVVLASISLGFAAGINEELAFRGIFQTVIANKLGSVGGLCTCAAVFGMMHAVTPLYALLASTAGAYLGLLFLATGNIVVPIVSHSAFDVASLVWSHVVVTNLTRHERLVLAQISNLSKGSIPSTHLAWTPPHAISIVAAVLVGIFFGSSIIFAVFHCRRSRVSQGSSKRIIII